MSITASLNGSISVTDASTGTVALTKVLQGFSMTGTAFGEVQSASIGTSAVTISLPISPTNFIYIVNTHATQTLTVTWTPNGQSSVVAGILGAGSSLIWCQTTGYAGITALSLTGSATATTCEYILAG